MKLTGIKGVSGRGWLIAAIGILGIIGGARVEVWANDIAYREVIRRTDYISAGVGGLRNVGSGTITIRGMTGAVERAWLYWAGPSNNTNPVANANVTLNGRAAAGAPIGSTSDNIWGYAGSHAYRADVTDIVAAKGNGAYALAGMSKQGTNINVNGASLLVFYHDNYPSNDRDIVLFDGNDSNMPNLYDMLGWNVRLSGIRYTNGVASLQLHVSDGQSYKDGAVMVNGKTLIAAGGIFQGTTLPSANNGPINNGDLWDIRKFDVTAFLRASPNQLGMSHRWINPGGDCLSLVIASINLPAGAAPVDSPELTNRPPSILAENEITIHTPSPVVLHAEASDIDGDPLTTAISMDGVLMHTGRIERSIPVTTGTLRFTNAFTLGTHAIIFAVSDGRLSADCVMALRVVDNTPPVLTVPENILTRTDLGKATAAVTFAATATDDFPGDITIVCLPLSGSAFPIGVTTVNCSATDTSGNVARGHFTVTVTDPEPPTITCPPDIIRPANRGTNFAVVAFVIAHLDNAPGFTIACLPPSGSIFRVGSTPVNCIARDLAGNTATCTFNVLVGDNEPPNLGMPPTLVVANDVGQCSAAVSYDGLVRVSDNMPGVAVACLPPSGTVFPVGTNVVRCTATDAVGNSVSNSFKIVVLDTEKPVLALPADIITPCAPGKPNAAVTYSVSATDNCTAAPLVTCTPASGSLFPCGTNTVRCTARDDAGNVALGTFKVIVQDTEPPVIVSIRTSKTYLWPPNHKMVPISIAVVATDNCPPVRSRIVSVTSSQSDANLDKSDVARDWQITGALTLSLRSERIPQSAPRLYTIRIEAKDMAGNVAYGTTVVNVNHSSSN